MNFSEKSLWLMLGAFCVSVVYGLSYQALYQDVAPATTLMPISVAICTVHLLGARYDKTPEVANLWIALLIWLYFPLAIVVGFLTAALGCDEGVVTPRTILSPLQLGISLLIVVAATMMTLKFLRARHLDPAASVLPYVFRSGALQLLLGPLLLFAYDIT